MAEMVWYDESWKDSYDAWKTASPDDEFDDFGNMEDVGAELDAEFADEEAKGHADGLLAQLESNMTLGAERVRLSFNPSGSSEVEDIKRRAADAIDWCADRYALPTGSSEQKRCYALAMTAFEEAAMWAVKAVTTPVQDTKPLPATGDIKASDPALQPAASVLPSTSPSV